MDRGGRRIGAALGVRVCVLVQAGIRSACELAATRPGRLASTRCEHDPSGRRADRANDGRVVGEYREAVALSVDPLDGHIRHSHQRTGRNRARSVGTLLWLGLPGDPHQIALTLVPAVLASGLLIATWLAARPSLRYTSPHRDRFTRRLAKPVSDLNDGITEARELLSAGNWKLTGALAYYAFDNAVLWAAFQAYGHAAPVGVVAMGYLVGSLAGALPIPAGLGVVDGGLVGALVLYGAPVAPAAAAVLLYRGISLSLLTALGAVGWISTTDRAQSGLARASAWSSPPPERSSSGHSGPWIQRTGKRSPAVSCRLATVLGLVSSVVGE